MKKIKKFNSIHEMDDEQKEKYIELIYRNCKPEIKQFFQANKEYIKNQLSGNAKKLFEKDVLQNDNLKSTFLKQIIEKLDDTRIEKLNIKIIKGIFSEDKELADSIAVKKEVDEKRFAEYIARCDDKKKKLIYTLFECFGVGEIVGEDEVLEAANNLEASALKKELEKKERVIKKLEDEKREAVAQKDSELESLKKNKNEEIDSLRSDITNKNEEIEKLKKENEELKNRPVKVETVYIEKNYDEPVSSEAIEENDTEEDESVPKIDIETVLNDLESRTLLGVVKAEGIQPSKSWIIITPVSPIIGENSNIDKEKFSDVVDYRGDYSTFMLFINQRLLKRCLSEDDALNYQYYSNDEKYDCLFDAFCKKIIFFTPSFVDAFGTNKYKMNAELVGVPVDYEDFSNSTFVPFYDCSKKEFESKISKHEDLILDNYPVSLSSKLRYVYVKDTIYEINYIPVTDNLKDRLIRWKFNGQDGKSPFRRLDIKVSDRPNEKYILVPNYIHDGFDGLYVKNIILIQPSTKTNLLFDEDEFIANINENAKSRNLYYEENDLKDFHVAIKSSNLVILAGPSGIGKTKLPMVYASTLGLDIVRNTLLFVPISPSYLEPEDVLGYVRPISEEKFNAEYMESQTGLVSFLIHASENKDKIHLVIFDEMNLSQIEHWFAPFISLLEQEPGSRVLNLYSNNLILKNGEKYPSSIEIGENVFFIGTINIDETTKQISDRLLDRAIVINLAAPSFISLKNMDKTKPETYQEVSFSRFATAIAKVENVALEFAENEFALINELNDLLTKSVYNKGISFRSFTKMALYIKNSAGILSREDSLDFVISQIVVKRINGSREELDGILSDDDTQGILNILNRYSDIGSFTKTRKVIDQKVQELNKYGFTR